MSAALSRHLPTPPGPVLVGFSGGVDSSVLLHVLAGLPAYRSAGLRAVHVHHGLHPDADRWREHCQAFCAALGLPLEVRQAQVARDSGLGLEGAARAARLAAFAEVLRPGEWLALAQHRDDQAETFLLRALRASGPDGLAAMPAQRAFAAGQLWRPLLALPRAELLAYAHRHGLQWIEDPANADPRHDRNFLRHCVLPLLRERWPQAEAALARSAALSGEASALLLAQEDALLERLLDAEASLDLAGLGALPTAQRARLLRRWVALGHAPALPASGVAALERELLQATDGARFAWQQVEIRRWRGRLHLLRPGRDWPPGWQCDWDGRQPLDLPDGGRLSLLGAAGFEAPLCVRPRQGGERLRMPGRAHSHLLKHLLQDSGLPPWQRGALPLLWDDGELLAAGDRWLSARLAGWLEVHQARLHWQPPMAAAGSAN